MALVDGSIIEIALNMRLLNTAALNVWQYEVTTVPVPVEAVSVAEAWWNHVKATYRAMVTAGYGQAFLSVRIRDLVNPQGDLAEWDIPTGEQAGTRANPTQSTAMPPFLAAGVRLTVGSRATRPGQKRFAFLVEEDNANGELQVAMKNLVIAHMNVMTPEITLGAPALATQLQPIVVRKTPQGTVSTFQNVGGYVVNPFVTTQNSRKFGVGI